MAQQPIQAQIISGQNIMVPAPSGGENIRVPSSPSGNLTFEFDVTIADPARSENDLVLTMPDGTVTISDFFAVGDETLPTLTVDGNTIAATDFFDGSGMDMTTAAGPAASRADGSGTSYDDGAGALIDGVDKLGSLGTFHWDRAVEFPENDLGLLGPMGGFALSVDSNWGGNVIGGVYEDGRPAQHRGDYDTISAGRLDLNINTGAGTTVGNIVFSDVPKGSFFLGDPSGPDSSFPNGASVIQPDASGNYTFTEEQFTSPGIYYLPVEQDAAGNWTQDSSDADISFTISVDFIGANGSIITQSQTGTIIVDAVADKPTGSSAAIEEQGHTGGVEELVTNTSTDPQFTDDGWHKTEQETGGAESISVTIPFSVTTTFSDYNDNSELHYVLVEVPTVPQGAVWTCDKGTPVSLWFDSAGKLVGETLPAGANPAQYTSRSFFEIPVDNADILTVGSNGTITIDANFTVSGDTSTIGDDTTVDLKVVAKAEELANQPGDRELTYANNIAYDETSSSLTLDIINSSLTVNAGWASEGNNDAKHVGGDSSEYESATLPDKGGATSEAASGDNLGAPINLHIDGSAGKGEFIKQLTFTLDENAEGTLSYSGSGTLTFTQNADGSTTYTLTFTDDSTRSVDDLLFVPAQDSTSDADVNISYTATIANGTGVENTFGGTMTVAIDAVADRSDTVTSTLADGGTTLVVTDTADPIEANKDNRPDPDTGWETDSFQSIHGVVKGEKFLVKVTADFPDSDGSENHYILIQNKGDEWAVVKDDLPEGYELVSSNYQAKDGNTYFQIKVSDEVKGDIAEIEIPLQTTIDTTLPGGGSKDYSTSFITGTLVEEKVASGAGQEYDTANNLAENIDGTSIAYTLDVINSSVTVQTGWASEGNNDAKHLGQSSGDYQFQGDQAEATQNLTGGVNEGAPIRIEITGGTGSKEFIDSILIKHDGDGNFFYKGTKLPDDTGSFTDLRIGEATINYDASTREYTISFGSLKPADLGTDLVYRPADGSYSDQDVNLEYTLTVKNEEGSSSVFTGSSTIVIDAVADAAKDVALDVTDTPVAEDEASGFATDKNWQNPFGSHSDKGFETSTYTPEYTEDSVEKKVVSMKVSAHFADIDGSETHTILVEALDDWELALSEEAFKAGFKLSGTTVSYNEKSYYEITVPAGYNYAAELPNVSVDVTYTGTITADFNKDLAIYGKAEETISTSATASDREIDGANNIAYTEGEGGNINIQYVNSTLTVKAGWAAEDFWYNQHTSANPANPQNPTMQGSDKQGAQFIMTLGETGGTTDVFDSITLFYDGSAGTFVIPENSDFTATFFDPSTDQPITDLAAYNGQVKVVVEFETPRNEFNAHFQPKDNNSADEVRVDYEATVVNNGSSQLYEGHSHITIDAVADKPTDLEIGEAVYIDESQSAAMPGQEVRVSDITVTFGDFEDGSEAHYVIIQKNTPYKTSDNQACTTAIPTQDIVIMGDGDHGFFMQTIHYNADTPGDSTITLHDPEGKLLLTVGADGKDQDGNQVIDANWLKGITDGGTITQWTSGDTYYKLPVLNELLQESSGTIDLQELYVAAPHVEQDEKISLKTGGYAHETEKATNSDSGGDENTPPSREVTIGNNYANNLEIVEFEVGAVSSKPSFSVTNVYENATPNAHEGTLDKVLGTITMNGLDRGETAEVEFTFSAKSGTAADLSGLAIGSEAADGSGWELSGPNWVATPFEHENGIYTITVTIKGDGQPVELPFFPGNNYNSEDITVNYEVTITDDRSGHEKTWNSTDDDGGLKESTIIVDAVAQKPQIEHSKILGKEIPEGDGEALDEDNDGHYDKLIPGKVAITTTVTFQDYQDGSEEHVLYLEWNTDVALDYNNANCITYIGSDQQPHSLPIPKPLVYQVMGDKVFIKIPVSSEILQDAQGKLQLTVNYEANANAGDTTLTIRADALDKAEQVNVTGLKNENNLATESSDIHLSFATAGSIHIKAAENIYEGDQPDANIGSTAQQWGTELEFTPSLNPADTLDNLSIEYGRGTLYLVSNDKYPAKDDYINNGVFDKAGYDEAMQTLLGNSSNYQIIPSGSLTDDQIALLLEGGHLHFIPETDKTTNAGTDDTDFDISYSYTIVNHESGHNPPQGGKVELVVDAVAQQPQITVNWSDRTEADGIHTIPVVFEFYDTVDGSENHYILVKYIPGAKVTGAENEFFYVTNDDGSVTQYFKIPASSVTENGNNIEVDLSNVYLGDRVIGSSAESGLKIEIAAATVEKVTEGDGHELTYHNNTAVKEAEGAYELLIPGHEHEGEIPHLIFTAGFEDGTPNAHMGEKEQTGDAKISICPSEDKSVNEITLTYNPEQGTIVIGGNVVVYENQGNYDNVTIEREDNGHYTVTIKNPPSEIGFRPGDFSEGTTGYLKEEGAVYDPEKHHNHSDADISIGWSLTSDKGSSSESNAIIVIDAVAQQGSLADADNFAEAIGRSEHSGNETVTVKVPVTYPDDDGSETHYLLVEKQPGIDVVNPGTELVQIKGMTYYKIPLDKDHKSGEDVEVILSVNDGLTNNVDTVSREGTIDGTDATAKDGSTIYTLGTGVLSVETAHEGKEILGDNNVAFSGGKTIEFKYSTVDTRVSISASDTYEHGDGPSDHGKISVNLTPDANDKVKQFSITYDSNRGELLDSNGNPFVHDPQNGLSISGPDANGKITITFTPAQGADSLGIDTLASINNGFQFHPSGFDSTDTEISWSLEVHDPLSNEVYKNTGKTPIVIDAVAQAPEVDMETSGVFYTEDTQQAALSGGNAKVVVNVTFPDDGSPKSDGSQGEVHYAVFSRGTNWESNSATVNGEPATVILIYDKAGNAYYAVEVPAGVQDANVVFDVKLPSSSTDWNSNNIKLGAIATESFIQPDGELTTSNNWEETLKDSGSFKVGVVETVASDIALVISGDEDEATIITMPDLSGKNETVVITVDKNSLKGGGVFQRNADDSEWVPAPTDENGNFVLDGSAGPYAYQGPANSHGPFDFKYTAVVTDTLSGASKEFNTPMTAEVTLSAVADAPVFTTEEMTPSMDGGTFSLPVHATFGDTDGSETHFILVKTIPGLVLQTHGATLVDGKDVGGIPGEMYYQFSAGRATFDKTLTFTIEPGYQHDSVLEVYGYSVELSNKDMSSLEDSKVIINMEEYPFSHYTVSASNNDVEEDYSNLDLPIHFTGGSGDDTITGSGYGDTIKLGMGNDYLYGSEGNDILAGGGGIDILDYSTISGGGIVANLKEGTITFGDQETDGWKDTIREFEVLKGTDNDDTINAAGDAMTIYGGKGNDTINAGEGKDIFAWALDDLGQGSTQFTDTISGFTLGKDKLFFESDILNADDLIAKASEAVGTSFKYEDEQTGHSFEINLSGEDSYTITLSNGEENPIQTINLVDFDFGDYASNHDFADLIQTLIKVNTGN